MSRKEDAALTGQTMEFISPSNLTIVIREQNGDDEDVISKHGNLIKGDSVHYFLAGIILSINGKPIRTEDVINMRNRDKYHTLVKSRILSLGKELTYKHRCGNKDCNKPAGTDDPIYEEDLSLYDKDFSPNAVDKREDFKYRIQAYKVDGAHKELTLPSGKELRWKFLTGVEEKKALIMSREKLSKNSDIQLRDLEWKNEAGAWQKISNFSLFSSKEMAVIRKDIAEHDEPFEAISECTCPYCGNVDYISLLAQTDFFFPGENQ
jgi:hypothetical protein